MIDYDIILPKIKISDSVFEKIKKGISLTKAERDELKKQAGELIENGTPSPFASQKPDNSWIIIAIIILLGIFFIFRKNETERDEKPQNNKK